VTDLTIDPQLQQKMSAAIAALSMDAVEQANSGHPGMPMGMADVATVLFTKFMKFDAKVPTWPDRDRFVLSAGHGSMLIYSLTYLLGYEDMTIEQIKNFRQLGAKTAGHPEFGHAPGVETTTGPLGQGIANAVGMAMAEAHLNAKFGDELVDHYTYCIAGDGCLMEGISQEAIALAGHLNLKKLIVLWDDNEITIDGPVSMSDSTDQLKRFEASGWVVSRVDGHDMAAVEAAIADAQKQGKPSLIACRTTIGKGADKKAGTAAAHGAPLGSDEIAFARNSLDWDHAPFDVPADVLDIWRTAGARGAEARDAWEARLAASAKAAEFNKAQSGDYADDVRAALDGYIKELIADPQKVATRKASQMALEVINDAMPITLGGSADLTGSNNTRTGELGTFTKENYAGRYVYYGIREHGMAAAMNGIALHGGVVPYGGTFMVFTDYCRPSIRLSALMEQRVIYVMTHDSIGLGEDGPTHQPVEHLAALRAIPNLHVFRPADVVETAECWEAALAATGTPSILALSRQGLPQLRLTNSSENLSAKGGYILDAADDYQATLIATGSEVSVAMDAKNQLAADGINVNVVSMPCVELFVQQSPDYMMSVLGDKPRIVIEAGIRQGWDRTIFEAGGTGDFIGMSGFGASAPAPDLFKHFGITAEAAVAKVKEFLS
jgi:transketolase